MSFWKKAVGALFGGGKTTEKVMEITDEAINTSQERMEQDSKDTAAAREGASIYNLAFNAIVDGVNRLQRPSWGAYFLGGVAGWWELSDVEKINAYWAGMITLYLTFLFGGRALLKDLPAAIAAILKVKGK